MCIACAEFIKGTLKFDEFKRALRETTREDSDHLAQVAQKLGQPGLGLDSAQGSDQELRDKLKTGK